MIKIPLKDPKPDFEELLKVLSGEKEPTRVHFVEMLIDEEIKKILIEDYFGEKNYPPTVTFGGSKEGVANNEDYRENKEASEEYYKQLINFYYRMGYSVLADYEFLVNFQAFNTVGRIGRDQPNNALAREQRHWAQEGIGLIKNEDDFEIFPWESVNKLVVNYYDHLEFLSKNLPDGMTIAVVGSVLEQVMEWLLGYEGVLYNVYDNPKFLELVFDKVGQIVLDLYKIAVSMEKVGIIWHGDDLGYKTGTILSPDHLKKWVFPWFNKYAELVHKHDKPIWFHACGNKTEVMEDFISSIKFDAIHSFEDSCCSIIDYKENYGNRIALLGGIDIDKLTRLNEDDLRTYIKKVLYKCMPGGRFAFGSGNSISNYIPVKNFLIMLEEGNNFIY